MIRDLHAALVSDNILENLYNFIVAGFFADIGSEYSGISVTLTGWRDKMDLFLEEVMRIFFNPNLGKLNSITKSLFEKYLSAINAQPYQLAYERLGNIILEDYTTNSEKIIL